MGCVCCFGSIFLEVFTWCKAVKIVLFLDV